MELELERQEGLHEDMIHSRAHLKDDEKRKSCSKKEIRLEAGNIVKHEDRGRKVLFLSDVRR